jgi:hypothetical protein
MAGTFRYWSNLASTDFAEPIDGPILMGLPFQGSGLRKIFDSSDLPALSVSIEY